MRAIFGAIFIVCVSIVSHPAAGQDRTSRIGERTFSFLNFWRQQSPAQSPARKGSGRSHASTSCLPGNLKAALADVQARFGPVAVISTHRSGAQIRGGRPSLHASCQAVDFRPARGTYGRVAAHLRTTWTGGFGTYSSGHIHIDVGPNLRWHAGGGSGKRG